MPKIYSAGDTVPAADLSSIAKVAGGYAASSTGNDSYVITVTPTPSSLVTGDVFYFKPDVSNTGACTINVNSLGVKTIKKFRGTSKIDLGNNDLVANSIYAIAYDGTDFILLNQSSIKPKSGRTTHDNSTTTTNTIPHGLGCIPQFVRITAHGADSNAGGGRTSWSFGTYDGADTNCIYVNIGTNFGDSGSFVVRIGGAFNAAIYSTATITVDATNITLTWTKTGSDTGTTHILWEAYP